MRIIIRSQERSILVLVLRTQTLVLLRSQVLKIHQVRSFRLFALELVLNLSDVIDRMHLLDLLRRKSCIDQLRIVQVRLHALDRNSVGM